MHADPIYFLALAVAFARDVSVDSPVQCLYSLTRATGSDLGHMRLHKKIFQMMVKFGLCMVLSWGACSAVLAQPSNVLNVDGLIDTTALAPYTSYWFESDNSALERAALRNFAGFQALPTDEISFGYTSNRVWLLINTHNDSAQEKILSLDTNVKYMRPLEIYEIRNGAAPDAILLNDENSVFSARGVLQPKIVVPLQWQPNETKQLLLRVGAGGALSLPLELSAPQPVDSKYGNARSFAAFFSGVLISLILINLFHFVTVKRLEHLLYALMESSILLFVLHNEGFAFQYLWPNSPLWNAHATQVLGHSTNMLAALFAMSFLELHRRAPLFYRTLLGLASVSAVLLLLTLWLEARTSNQLGLMISALGGSVIVAAGIRVLARGHKPALYFVLGWFFMASGAALYGLSNLAFIRLSMPAIEVLKLSILVEAILISYGLSALLKFLSDKVRSSQKELISVGQMRLDEALERVRLEESRAHAERELANKALDVARTSHDIRQPIHSLRLALLAQAREHKDATNVTMFNRTLDHMEVLLTNISEKESESSRSTITTYGQLMGQLCEEFEAAAIDADIELVHVSSSVPLSSAVVPLKRVMSNLLSNALRHSNASKILLGLRRRSFGVEVLVIDNGLGLDQADSNTSGTGLGMGIVSALCREHDWASSIKTESGRGTCCSIRVHT